MSSIIASPLVLHFLLAVTLQNIVALPKCFPENKPVTMSAKEPFHIYCTLHTVPTGDRFVWMRDKVILGACSVNKCQRNFDRYDVILSDKNPKVLSLHIGDLTSKDNGEYSLSIQSPNSEIKNIPIMNLTVVLRSLETPECATTVWKDNSSIELSCKLKNPVRHRHISVSILAGNTSLVNVHFRGGHPTSVIVETINDLKYKIDYTNLSMETSPSRCLVTNKVEAKSCPFAQIIELTSINNDEYLTCSTQNSVEVKSDVWLIKMFHRTIKLLPTPQNFVGEEILHGNNIVLAICGTETDKTMEVYKVFKVVMNGYDTCYTAYVDKSLTETTFRISGCAFTTLITGPTSGYGDVGINATTLRTQYTDSNYSLSASTKPINMDMKSTFGPADDSEDNKYEIIFYMISTLAFLCSIVTCLSMVRRHKKKSKKKLLRSQYHNHNHRLTSGSEIADNTDTAATDLIALHPLDPSNEAQSSLIRSHQDRGEVSRSWLSSQSQETHPALPPRDTCRSSNQKTSAEFHFYSKENENGKFPSLEPPENDNKNKDSEGGKAKMDALNGSENIYNTVSDEMDEKLGASADISLISDSASIFLDYKEALHVSKPGNDFGRAVAGDSQPEVKSSNLRTESDFNSSSEVCVEKLYAKPNKKTKSNSFSTSVFEENLAVSPSPGETSDYEELRH